MAVDYGDAHTGLATCDSTETIVSPLAVIHERNTDKLIEKIKTAALGNNIDEIVVGNPVNMNGTRGTRSEKCELFAEKLKKAINVPVLMWDERSTTLTAHNIMNQVNKRGKKRREVIDAVAAAVILENYLMFRRNNS